MSENKEKFQSVEKLQIESRLNIPTKVSKEQVDTIPETCGIYKFFNDQRASLYRKK